MKRRSFLALVAVALTLALVGQDAGAAEFSPTITFKLSDPKAGANPSLEIKVAQDKDEEELAKVQLEVPAGFTLPTDAQIAHDTSLGAGNIIIDVGPRCRDPRAPLSGAANVPVSIKERDRSSPDIAEGAIAKWLVDIQGVSSIPLVVKGSTADGYTLEGTIMPNSDTCPPFSFTASINKTAAGVEIIKNPAAGGEYTFGATFTGVSGSTAKIAQPVTIEGGAAGGGTTTTGLTAAEKKKCKKINAKFKANKKKYRAKLRKCFKRERAD